MVFVCDLLIFSRGVVLGDDNGGIRGVSYVVVFVCDVLIFMWSVVLGDVGSVWGVSYVVVFLFVFDFSFLFWGMYLWD